MNETNEIQSRYNFGTEKFLLQSEYIPFNNS